MPTEQQINNWSDAYDALREAKERLAEAINTNDGALEAYKADHSKALEAYEKASEELG